MRRLGLFLISLGMAAVAVASEEVRTASTEEVLDAPGGRPVAILLPGAVRKTVEERDGFIRVAVEGWIRSPGAAPQTGPAGAAANSTGLVSTLPSGLTVPSSPTSAPPALSGSVVARLSNGELRYGAGARVSILGSPVELERERTALKSQYESSSAALDEEIRRLEEDRKTALNSSDNLEQSRHKLDETRRLLVEKTQEKRGLAGKYASRAEEIFRRYQVAETVADPAGRFAFPSLPPGSYRIRATFTFGDLVHHWYLPVEIGSGGGIQMDLSAEKVVTDPLS